MSTVETTSALGPRELARWLWRQLTSMSTALVLLLLLALAAIPGSLIPQSGVDTLAVSQWREDHPKLAPVFAQLGLFSVYNSVWFSAIYLLLVVSLIGCIVPRTRLYLTAMRAAPPAVPARLDRLPLFARIDQPVADPLTTAERELRRRGFRVVRTDAGVCAEKGYLREAGNLVFHVAILLVLVGYAAGSTQGYKGGVIVVEGDTFTNRLTQYDDFAPGSLFQADDMEPFAFRLDSFDLNWIATGPGQGTARDFVAELSLTRTPGAEAEPVELRVNEPLKVGGTEVFLIGHGYAPIITVTDGEGRVVYSGPTIFLPTNPQTFESYGVVKVPGARPGQLAFDGGLYPTYAFTMETGPYSLFGDDLNPAISMLAYTGDLGLNSGPSQSVYQLERSGLRPIETSDGNPFRIDLIPGEEVELPDGLGTVRFDGMRQWTRLQISRTPLTWLTLLGVLLMLLGMMASLYVQPARVWVRTGRDGSLEVGGLDRSGRSEFDEFDEIRSALSASAEEAP